MNWLHLYYKMMLYLVLAKEMWDVEYVAGQDGHFNFNPHKEYILFQLLQESGIPNDVLSAAKTQVEGW